MSIFGAQGLAFATPQNPLNKEEIFQLQIKEIMDTETKNISAIRTAAAAYRRALEERTWRSKVMEEADISVCNIRMQRKIEKAREETFQETAVPGPIRKLPTEMLSTIFRYHVEDDLSPWILVKVSKLWLHTAMATPHLWCHLMVVSQCRSVSGHVQYIFNGEPHCSFHNIQLCEDVAQLQAALGRSGAALPLTIKLGCSSWEGNDVTITLALLQILRSPISERIRGLDIRSVNIQTAEYGTDTPIGPFPLLRSVTLPSGINQWTHRFLESVSSTSRSLESVVVTHIVSPELAAFSFWRRVKRVVLTRYNEIYSGLNHLIAQLSSVEYVEGLPSNWPTQDTSPAVWENMRQLSLSCDPRYLGHLQLPQLETFTFQEHEHGELHPLSEYGRLSYPALVTLDVEVKSPLWPQYTAGAFPVLLNLTLKCRQDDEVIVDILSSVPTVRNVKIIGPSSKTFGFQLLQDLQSDEESLVCPNLERLTLGSSEIFRVQTLKSNNGPLCKALVKFRRDIGKPLQELTVNWHYRKEVTDYAAIA